MLQQHTTDARKVFLQGVMRTCTAYEYFIERMSQVVMETGVSQDNYKKKHMSESYVLFFTKPASQPLKQVFYVSITNFMNAII